MKAVFRLRFPVSRIRELAGRYEYEGAESSDDVLCSVRTVRERGYLLKADLRKLARWKSPRSAGRIERNSGPYVKTITAFALETSNERARIEVLTALDGVGWPTASSILHFFHRRSYPILDFRALESLSVDVPNQYTFDFWWAYVEFCRRLRGQAKTDMRTLDRALWQYSKERGG